MKAKAGGRSRKSSGGFPLSSNEDFDFIFSNAPYPIGLRSTYPPELKRKVAAAVAAFRGHLRSLDHAYRTYTDEADFLPTKESRLDIQISSAIMVKLTHSEN
jgi:hypothetical protein